MDVEVYIAGAARTAIGGYGGSLGDIPAYLLGKTAVLSALERAGAIPELVGETYMGCVFPSGQNQNPARKAAMNAGIPPVSCAATVNMESGSGLKAVQLAAQSVLTGDIDIAIAGGMESMSNNFFPVSEACGGEKAGKRHVFGDTPMKITAEMIAERYHISREEEAAFIAASYHKAEAADFSAEIVPVDMRSNENENILLFAKDECIEKERLTQIHSMPVFGDGAAALVLCSEKALTEYNLRPIARIVSFGQIGMVYNPTGIGLAGAVGSALGKAGWRIDDIDLIELDEAFAAQGIAAMRDLRLNPEKVNIKGGAIALGYPVGASGARILVTLLYAMEERNKKKGLAALCTGGGMGVAALVERI